MVDLSWLLTLPKQSEEGGGGGGGGGGGVVVVSVSYI